MTALTVGAHSRRTFIVIREKAPSFITNGSVDGTGHPAVVLIIIDSAGSPLYRCTGTLLSPTVVLTAGDCAGQTGEFSGMRVFRESDVQAVSFGCHGLTALRK